MAAFDFDSAARWVAKFQVKRTLARRPDSALPFVGEDETGGQELVLDTSVYIDQLQDRTPRIIDRLTANRTVNHSTVAIAELMHGVGVLDPGEARTASAIEALGRIVKAMPRHRVLAPDADVIGRAALLAGVLCRLQAYGSENRFRAVNDCTLFLQARKLGLTLLTGNVKDFDFLLQLVPAGRVLLYRKT